MEWLNSFFPVKVHTAGVHSAGAQMGKWGDPGFRLDAYGIVFFSIELGGPVLSGPLRDRLYAYANGYGFHQFADLGHYTLLDEEASAKELAYILGDLYEMGKTVLIFCDINGFVAKVMRLAHHQMGLGYAMVETSNGVDLLPSGPLGLNFTNDVHYYGLLAYQGNHITENQLAYLDKLGFESLRLGMLKTGIHLAEPMVRMANYLHLDFTAIKTAHMGLGHSYPNGLLGEEACAILRYAGANTNLWACSLHADDFGLKHIGAEQFAQMIWYFVEGVSIRCLESPLDGSRDYLLYTVGLDKGDNQLRFIKSVRTDRWWIHFPVENPQLPEYKYLIPCSYADYEEAARGEIPFRWVQAAARLSFD
ncbi:MAG: hypothetical protein HYZ16_12485 [Bacteroidetes bacterium]|jgi:hypothetical protein|nr:hypothetical protein [Bacteroidota bacterium]